MGGVLGRTFLSSVSGPVNELSLSDTEIGFRVPLGMSVLVRGNPVELFFEIAPELTIHSNPMTAAGQGKYAVYADGAIGARYYY